MSVNNNYCDIRSTNNTQNYMRAAKLCMQFMVNTCMVLAYHTYVVAGVHRIHILAKTQTEMSICM